MVLKAQFDCTIASALEQMPFDLVIQNAKYVNILTKEIYSADIGIKDGKVARVTQPNEGPLAGENIFDASGKYAIPGLIDTHVHIESSMMTPCNMAKVILPHGTTTIACDPHEIGNVCGIDGVNYILEASAGLPLDVFVLAPSCVPSAMGVETAGAILDASDIDKMFENARVIGLGEVMDFPAVIHQKERISDIIATAKTRNVFLQGHCPMLTGAQLNAYQASGVNSCHETAFTEEALYKLRAGMTVECRESSITQNIKAILPAVIQCNYPPNTTICTDDREPDDLLRDGHIDHVIRRCIQEGGNVIEIIRMATYNAANLLRLHDRGLLIPGNVADIVLLDDLEAFHVNEVFSKGTLVAKDGAITTDFSVRNLEFEKTNTVHLTKAITAEDFKIKAPKGAANATMNLIKMDDHYSTLTHLCQESIPVCNGFMDDSRDDLAIFAVFERHGKAGTKSICFVKDSGLNRGAIASTVSHDCHNLVVIGKNAADMTIAANNLMATGGGFCCVCNGEVLASLALPIGGLMSELPVEKMAVLTSRLKQVITSFGLKGSCPIIQVASLALPVIPSVRLTDLGLVDVETQTFIPLFANE